MGRVDTDSSSLISLSPPDTIPAHALLLCFFLPHPAPTSLGGINPAVYSPDLEPFSLCVCVCVCVCVGGGEGWPATFPSPGSSASRPRRAELLTCPLPCVKLLPTQGRTGPSHLLTHPHTHPPTPTPIPLLQQPSGIFPSLLVTNTHNTHTLTPLQVNSLLPGPWPPPPFPSGTS